MIVWLASYPRSGNTLLRQVLKACFHLDSCEGLELVPAHLIGPQDLRAKYYGSYLLEGDTEEFYHRARNASELILIKSHQVPRDDAKAIYIVRDGRLALRSFVKFQDTFHPNSSSFESVLLGDHPYGDWATHYRVWCDASRGETLVVRFEELVNADAGTLARLAVFLGFSGPVQPWANPLAVLRECAPAEFGSGDREWRPDPFWSETRLRQFMTLHGPLLAQLGYATASEVEAIAYPLGSDEEQMLRFTFNLVARRNALQATCDERMEVINRLARACDERLALITRLNTELTPTLMTCDTESC